MCVNIFPGVGEYLCVCVWLLVYVYTMYLLRKCPNPIYTFKHLYKIRKSRIPS